MEEVDVSTEEHECPSVFEERFARYKGLLFFIARRVVSNDDRADEAVRNGWLRTSLKPPRFEEEGAFRSWLLRILIDEAMSIRRQTRNQSTFTIARTNAP
jgi:RNA polymerase sigma-70 factor (ECF subfamily)